MGKPVANEILFSNIRFNFKYFLISEIYILVVYQVKKNDVDIEVERFIWSLKRVFGDQMCDK